MRIEVSFRYMKNSEFIENALENNFQKLKRRLKIFTRDDPIHVSVHIEKNPHREQYFCRARAYLPHFKVLAVEEKAGEVSLSINKTFSAIIKRIDKVKEKMEGHRRKKGIRHVQESVEP